MGIKFGTDGWRAVMAEDFTFYNVEKVIQGISNFLNTHEKEGTEIVIGYDNRFLSPEFAVRAAEVLAGNGFKPVIGEKPMPTPVTAFAVVEEQAGGALMFTASHNPPEYNGVKFIPDYGGPALPDTTAAIEAEVEKITHTDKIRKKSYQECEEEGLLRVVAPGEKYLRHLRELIEEDIIQNASLKVAIDPMFGVGIGYLEQLLTELGCQVKVIHNYRDPLFGGKMPEPSDNVLAELKELVTSEQLDVGLAMDGDADRFGIIDKDGSFINANQVLSLIYYHLLEKGIYGPVTKTVSTTQMLNRIAAGYQQETFETPVGFKYIAKNLMEAGCILGGEESGGLSIQGHIPEKDGILACLLVVEVLAAKDGRSSLKTLMEQIYQEYGYLVNERLDIRTSSLVKETVLNKLKEWRPDKLGDKNVVEHSTLDGLKLHFEDGSWALIRPSGTEPLFRIYCETNSSEELRTIQKAVRQTLSI